MVFDACIVYDLLTDDSDELLAEAREVAEWTSNTFKRNFVIIEQATRLLAGGAVDNKKSWCEGWNELEQYEPTGKYQLRCYIDDATWFLLKYKDK